MKADEKREAFSDGNPPAAIPAKVGIRIYGSGRPVRLLVAGLHGEEWKDTTGILEKLKPPETGTLALIPLVSREKYVSTLDPRYYPGMGKPIIETVEKLEPEIYIELHSYGRENFEKLAGKDRIDRAGVPAYSILKAGVLLGSVSPHIRRKYFPKEALCLSFEIEKGNLASREFASLMVEKIKEIGSRDEFITCLRKEFPEQAKKAVEDYRRFYGEI
ncbi:hypothetical protein MSMTP_1259 [Methanosarcina sp. MTP4]|uniref:DUF2119 domain-containing protein n=1 Tax=Methanosarcina sp. MTP4 TaxID=1434100 RepID=UPI000615594F|nr:DUF2119 domain-containing protein [Methanosarcina sp. MTP4]AKB24728.1 hypothetical protein MSMTP_1259 [Methanosarcina sp. MTP4]